MSKLFFSATVFALLLATVFCTINYSAAQITEYKIGDKGPAGGVVFFDKGDYYGGWRYLEAAPEDQSSGTEWGCYGTAIPGDQPAGVGSGYANSVAIVSYCQETSAAAIALQYRGGGKSDWFLPSQDELKLMYDNLHRKGLGDFARYGYWSSTEEDEDLACYHGFLTGSQKKFNKYNSSRVRAIRAF